MHILYCKSAVNSCELFSFCFLLFVTVSYQVIYCLCFYWRSISCFCHWVRNHKRMTCCRLSLSQSVTNTAKLYVYIAESVRWPSADTQPTVSQQGEAWRRVNSHLLRVQVCVGGASTEPRGRTYLGTGFWIVSDGGLSPASGWIFACGLSVSGSLRFSFL